MKVDYINGRKTRSYYGTAKYSHEISKRFPPGLINRIEYPLPINSRYIDGFMRRYIYPHLVRVLKNNDHIHHITNQDLAFLLTEMEMPRSVVTCYDLIPWVYYKNRSRYWRKNIEGLRRADRIITISEFSKNEIIRNTGIPGDRIDVIYCGVDRNVFYPKRDRSPLKELGISEQQKVILYVGSEEPRKNLGMILEAMPLIQKDIPGVVLLKVGSPGMGGSRQETLRMIKKLHIEDRVIFTGDVSEEMLAKYYNAADLFVFPSLYEGFGLPVIEAMACGCPVVASNTSSIPEVAGDAAVLVSPGEHGLFAERIVNLCFDGSVRERYQEKGIIQASRYSWDEASEKIILLYRSMGNTLY